MATKSKASSDSKPKAAKTEATASASRTEQARSTAERAVDLPVGVVLEVSDRVADLVGPFTARAGAEKQFKSYRTNLTRSLTRSERRGASARRKATTEARKTRERVEQRVRAFGDQLTELSPI